jgi:hypothetical protein
MYLAARSSGGVLGDVISSTERGVLTYLLMRNIRW